ncbi:MAG: hypothetical protein AAB354_01650 [candidate division KSB1 bacterium]
MNLEMIRKYVNARPFKPLVFHLENGDKQLVKHPEIIITEVVIMAADEKGFPVVIAPEAVTSIHYAPAKPHRTRARRKPVTARK